VPVTIREITSEVVLGGDGDRASQEAFAAGSAGEEELVERVVRRALERVVERLRMAWEP
jgi:hypothetical protein